MRIIIYIKKGKEVTMTNGQKTKLSYANVKSKSLRTTIPTGIVQQLGLTTDDMLLWKLDKKNDEWCIIVKPIKNENKED